MKNITKQELVEFIKLGFFVKKQMFDDLGIKFLKFNGDYVSPEQNASIRRYLSIFCNKVKFARELLEKTNNANPVFSLQKYLKDITYFGSRYFYYKKFWIKGKNKKVTNKTRDLLVEKLLVIENEIKKLIGII